MNSWLKWMTQLAWASGWPRYLAYDTHVNSDTTTQLRLLLPPEYHQFAFFVS